MNALWPIGLALGLNAAVFGAGLVWVKRQAKRAATERTAEYRGLFQQEPLPPAGEEVLILVEEGDGRPSELTAVHWPPLGWTDAATLLPVEDDVLGWRRQPFRQEPPRIDYAGWTDEKIAAEIKRRCGDGEGG